MKITSITPENAKLLAQPAQLDMRDTFAAHAVAGLLSLDMPSDVPEWAKGLTVADYLARKAYIIADAMMTERGHTAVNSQVEK